MKYVEPLTAEFVNATLGYRIDAFQQSALNVILQHDKDVVAMAPTGSGKTAVALMAILRAFAQGKAACYTSPIKALSNQKFAEFQEWFSGHGIDAGVSLINGRRADSGATWNKERAYQLLRFFKMCSSCLFLTLSTLASTS